MLSYGQTSVNWLVYKNQKLGITMKYPSNWSIVRQNQRSLVVEFANPMPFSGVTYTIHPLLLGLLVLYHMIIQT
jgi:hypothetical protein